MDSPVTVYVKLKTDEKSDTITVSRDQSEIRFQDSKCHTYSFARVFPASIGMQEIYDTTTKPLVNFLKGGINSVVLAFGHRGTGKMTTLFGDADNGIFQFIIENLIEYAEEMENTKEVNIFLSVLELFEENIRDLAHAHIDPQDFSVFDKSIEIKEHLGKALINDATSLEVKNIAEANEILKESLEFRTNYEIKNHEYSENSHTFVLVYLKQRNKGSTWNQVTSSTMVLGCLASCERPKIKNGKEVYENPSISKGFHALSKVLCNIKSPKVPWREHPLTKILKIGISDAPKVVVISTINPQKNAIQDTIYALNFIEKCRPNLHSNLSERLTDEEIDLQIQKLQEEKADLKIKLRKIEIGQDNQIRKLCELMGIEDDLDGIINETNPTEIEKIQNRKESLTKVEKQVKRSLDLQKKLEENKNMLEKVKKLEFVSQEQHIKKVIDLKEHLQRLKDELLTIQFNSKYYEQEKIDAKSEELVKMVENSRNLINEKKVIVEKLPLTLNPFSKPINPEELKSQGKQEILELYRKRFIEQEKLQSEELKSAVDKKNQSVSDKQAVLSKMVENFQKTRNEKKQKIKTISKELIGIYDIVLAQKKLINAIQSGKFNQNLKTVYIPPEKIPKMPDKECFEE